MVEWAAGVAADLGGVDNLSRQQQTLLDLAARTKLQLDRIDAWLFRQPALVNKRTRALHPVVSQRQSLVNTLRQLLGDLGLERRARDVGTLDQYLRSRSNGPADAQPGAPASAGAAVRADAPASKPDAATGPYAVTDAPTRGAQPGTAGAVSVTGDGGDGNA